MTNFVAPEYLWLVVVGSLSAFAFGWGTGSNDVANAFGTSVGAKTLTLKQAVIIAICFEFTGALVLGRVSTSVIAGGIANLSAFQGAPEIYAFGMVCALSVGFIWQALASYWELNVSATHSIIGAIMGFSLVYGGSDAVLWAVPDKAAFPPYKGVVPIILSWFFSPVLTGLASAIIFVTVRTLVLRREKSYQLSFWVLPFMVLFTTWINIYFVFTKGAKKSFQKSNADEWSDAKAAWIAACCAAGLAFLTIIVVLPLLKWKADKKFAADAEQHQKDEEAASEVKVEKDVELERSETNSKFLKAMSSIKKAAMHGMEVDIHEYVADDPIVAAIHANAEVFDPKAEYAFSYLQVFSAICVIFAHGAGEVGYMSGPLSTIWEAVKTGNLPKSVEAPIWVILISAFGLVIGLATYGYNVTRSVGTRFSKLSPTRGFSAELATALVIMVAAQYGLPTSSSQCITGGIIGVGLLEGKAGVNWTFFAKTFASWIATLVVVGLSTAALFAQAVFAPSISASKTLAVYEKGVITTAQSVVKDVQSTLALYQNASREGRLSTLPYNATWLPLNASMAKFQDQGKTLLTPAKVGTIKVDDAMTYLQKALALYQQTTVSSIGQEHAFKGAALGACNDASFDPNSPSFNAACRGPQPLKGLGSPADGTKFP